MSRPLQMSAVDFVSELVRVVGAEVLRGESAAGLDVQIRRLRLELSPVQVVGSDGALFRKLRRTLERTE